MDDVNIGLYAGDLTYDPPDKNKKIGVIALSKLFVQKTIRQLIP